MMPVMLWGIVISQGTQNCCQRMVSGKISSCFMNGPKLMNGLYEATSPFMNGLPGLLILKLNPCNPGNVDSGSRGIVPEASPKSDGSPQHGRQWDIKSTGFPLTAREFIDSSSVLAEVQAIRIEGPNPRSGLQCSVCQVGA